ncbi:30S ribosomal protein S3 [bacterium (Candidatus Gribaldobacteria) CG_4_10_14_0_2_um_filter_41_16]|uniref:Small ribosomal subunit protein uS3 n=4 Tax=Candidatus Gribaldobacteria TaxID=2798536 RepID=A0A2M7VIF6_9BACT|nr:MAG: 30S ribosomal protein S3 [Parcubacteria group bacterium CG1_02_41_26]PIR91825.1 MAG: 30S ribosomal protein S3 [bacterium (Candidatus Gribaldobacteria) CG10_big_fil_rev_8_21_14_0_10_41_12]PIV46976.1 MAG: 30S ribosomal protein S3 [bacterium (Candidatus Gribaldobacteria) CG02_land_8_20_14_3_00_41_15]PIX03429.1 MAG: 30S ribosomal protein S3 [bacterium (Candidatus Gribaldobacteria) CG_4_8_14_3_um_filter_42_11]PJA01632.1 MAG: 30S ribosomal protein S3 [bacterium (Candidatus Gribaldobacteria) C
MSHKVHPKILKIREIKDWLSRGFYEKNFRQNLQEDYLLRTFLGKKLSQASVESLEIERGRSTLKIIIKTARPALVIGRGGQEVEKLKQGLDKILYDIRPASHSQERLAIKIEILEVRNPWDSAPLVGQWMAGQIEKRVPFRRVMKMALGKLKEQKGVQGARLEVSGRLNGAEISRTEWLLEGKMPRQNLRAIIDYSLQEARCAYGTIGIKVWIYRGEKF